MTENTCVICFESLLDKSKASPDVCDHIFCLSCLERWSRHGTYCPVDRKKFKKIISLDSQAAIQIKARKKKRKERTLYDVTIKCEKCNDTKSSSTLLLCDSCDLGYHCHCLVPPLKEIPPGQWYCPICVAVEDKIKNNKGQSKEIENIVYDNINLERSPAKIESQTSISHPRRNKELQINSEDSSCSVSDNFASQKSKKLCLGGSEYRSKNTHRPLNFGQFVPKRKFGTDTSDKWSESLTTGKHKLSASTSRSPDNVESDGYLTLTDSNDSLHYENFIQSVLKGKHTSSSSMTAGRKALRKSNRSKATISYQEDESDSSSESSTDSFGYPVNARTRGNSTVTTQTDIVRSPPPNLTHFDTTKGIDDEEDLEVIDIRSPPKLRLENTSGPKNLPPLSLKPGTSRDTEVILNESERRDNVLLDSRPKDIDSSTEGCIESTVDSPHFSVFQELDNTLASGKKYLHLNIAVNEGSGKLGSGGNVKLTSQPMIIEQRTENSMPSPSDNFAARQVNYAIKAKMNLPNELKKLEREKWKMWHSRSVKRQARLTKSYKRASHVNNSLPETIICRRWMAGNEVILEDFNKSPNKINECKEQCQLKPGHSLNPFQSSSQNSNCTKQIVTSEYRLPRDILKNSKMSRVPKDTFKDLFRPHDLKLLSIRKDGSLYLNWRKSKQ